MKTLLVMLLCAAAMAQDMDPARTQQLKDYLYQYGYLPASDLEKGVLRTERELEQATLRLQKFMGLEMTGKLDGPTMDLLGKPRCGMPDMMVKDDGQGIVEVSPPANYNVTGKKWNKKVYYGIESYSSDLDQGRQTAIIDEAADAWDSKSCLETNRVVVSNADIRIRFCTGNRGGCNYTFPSTIMAYASPPPGDQLDFNDAYTFTDDTSDYNLLCVATHEFGHNFGIAHSTYADAIMYPTYHYMSVINLHWDDLRAIRNIYGRYKNGIEC